MFMKESVTLSLADADDFTIDFEHVSRSLIVSTSTFGFIYPRLSRQRSQEYLKIGTQVGES